MRPRHLVFGFVILVFSASIAAESAPDAAASNDETLSIRFEGGLFQENFGAVVSSLGRLGKLRHELFIDRAGLTPSEILKNNGSLAGTGVPPTFDKYLCEINPHVCRLSPGRTSWSNQKAPYGAPELTATSCGPGEGSDLEHWVSAVRQLSLPKYVLCLPVLRVERYLTQGKVPYESSQQSLEALVSERGGCDASAPKCRGLVIAFNKASFKGQDPFKGEYSGLVRIPISGYKLELPFSETSDMTEIAASIDKVAADQEAKGLLAKSQTNISYSLSKGNLKPQALEPLPRLEIKVPPLQEMSFVPDPKSGANLPWVFIGVWDTYADRDHCVFKGAGAGPGAIGAFHPDSASPTRQIPTRAARCGDARDPDYYDQRLDHGTHVAAIIASRAHEIVAGINNHANLWVYEVGNGARIDSDNDPFIKVATEFQYQIPRVVNVSMAETRAGQKSPIERFIRSHPDVALFVVAAGGSEGSGVRIDQAIDCNVMPACLGAEGADASDWVLSVVAVDSSNKVLPFVAPDNLTTTSSASSASKYESNWGKVFNVAALGYAKSAVYGDYTKVLAGSSVAAPFATGLASLLFARAINTASPKSVKKRIEYTADMTPDLEEVVAWGRINFERALNFDSERIEIRMDQCDRPPDCTFSRRIDKKNTKDLQIERATRDGRAANVASLPISSVRRIARMPGDRDEFWMVVDNDGTLVKYSNVRFRGDPRLVFEDRNGARERSLATVESYTAAWDFR